MALGTLPSDSATKKFLGTCTNNAGANELKAIAGQNRRTQNAETVTDLSVAYYMFPLTFTAATPNPAGNDVIMVGTGVAPVAADLTIRNALTHAFQVPMSGYREVFFEYECDLNQTATITIFGSSTSLGLTGLSGAQLASFTFATAGVPMTVSVGGGGAVGVGGQAGGAAVAADNRFFSVPALTNCPFPYVVFSVTCGVAPGAGGSTLVVVRRS